MPAFVGESTEVLGRGEIGVTGAGGLGAVDNLGTKSSGQVAGAGEVRVRVGVGASQEVGVTGFGGVGSTSSSGSTIPYEAGAKLSYKIAPASWLAFVASGGAFDQSQTSAIGGDLAAIVAPYTDRAGDQLYTGVKGSFAIPVLQNARGATEVLTLPVGFALRSSRNVRVFFEGGALLGFAEFYGATTLPSSNGTSVGGYGAVAVRVGFR